VTTTLVTGGGGFIGGRVVRELLDAGHRVRILDCFDPEVHQGTRPVLPPGVEVLEGDVRDPAAVADALRGADRVVHLAAREGAGRRRGEVAPVDADTHGTAVLLAALAQRPIERLVLASSTSVYGEGAYVDADGREQVVTSRSPAQLEQGDWELRDASGRRLRPVPTPETAPIPVSAVHALGKYDQERLCLRFGESSGVPTVVLRLANVYGPGESLTNPYAGALAVFAADYLSGRRPLVYEDGGQRRDFVHVRDVAAAFRLALESEPAAERVLNIGSGSSYSVREVANRLRTVLQVEGCEPELTGIYRQGDVRHCFGHVWLAGRVIGYRPRVTLGDGLRDLGAWLESGDAVRPAA
jgi:dTDP-L-rhamnose 4-epimerase